MREIAQWVIHYEESSGAEPRNDGNLGAVLSACDPTGAGLFAPMRSEHLGSSGIWRFALTMTDPCRMTVSQ